MPNIRHIWIALAALAIAAPAIGQARLGDPLPVGLVLNGRPVAQPGLVVARDGHLLARISDLRGWGIDPARAPPSIRIDGEDYAALDAIPGLDATLAADGTSLSISASPELFPHLAFDPDRVRMDLAPIVPAQYFDYDLTVSAWHGRTRLSGLLDAGVSGSWGVLGSTLLVRSRGAVLTRLDTAVRRDFPAQRLRLAIGDTVSQPGPWGRPLRFGGVQFGTDLALDPQAINFPLPVIAGSAATPSTIELLSDAQRQSLEVQPGTFDVAIQPRMTGAGQVTMTIRDLSGNTRQVARNFYTSADLLRPGLTAFVIEAGALRRGYGQRSNSYGAFYAAAGLRRAVSPWLTIEGRAETGAGTTVAGIGASTVVGALGEVSAAAAVSRGAGSQGHMLRTQVRRIAPNYSLTASYETASAGYSRIGDLARDEGGRSELAIAGSYGLGGFGSVSLAHARLETGRGTPLLASFALSSVAFAANLAGGSLSAGVQWSNRREKALGQSDRSLFATYTLALGPRTSVALNAESGRIAATFDRGVPDDAGLGLRALVGSDRGLPWLEGSVTARLAAGELHIDTMRRGGRTGIQASARGALLRIDDTLLATPRIDYGFAIVDVAGDAAVTITVENRPVARRSGQGRRVILTGLQPYAANHIGVDAAAISIEATLANADQVVMPGWRQAAKIAFGDAAQRGARLRLLDESRSPLPVGALADWDGGSIVVGHDGEVWIEDYRSLGYLSAAYAGRHCRAKLPELARSEGLAATELVCAPYIETENVL